MLKLIQLTEFLPIEDNDTLAFVSADGEDKLSIKAKDIRKKLSSADIEIGRVGDIGIYNDKRFYFELVVSESEIIKLRKVLGGGG